MSKGEKIGRPSIEEEGVSVELGQPVIAEKYEKELIEATLPVVEDALYEFYRMRGERDKQAAIALQTMHAPEFVLKIASDGLKRETPDTMLAVAIFESARGELQLRRWAIELEDGGGDPEAEAKREALIDKDMHYQEAEERLFSADKHHSEAPTRDDLMDRLSLLKEKIKQMAKAGDEKFEHSEQFEYGEDEEISRRIWRSRLLTDVPAIERFLVNKETIRDYDEVAQLIDAHLWSLREAVGNLVIQYADDPKENLLVMIRKNLADIKESESFLAMLEGERNERIAKGQP